MLVLTLFYHFAADFDFVRPRDDYFRDGLRKVSSKKCKDEDSVGPCSVHKSSRAGTHVALCDCWGRVWQSEGDARRDDIADRNSGRITRAGIDCRYRHWLFELVVSVEKILYAFVSGKVSYRLNYSFHCIGLSNVSVFVYRCRGKVSATSFTIIGVMNKCLTILLNLVVWDQHAPSGGIVSLILCLIGGALYRQAPMR